MEPQFMIGTAGWNIPAFLKSHFPAEGTHLERYAQIFNAVEINSSFYRDHKYDTYRRWADSVPNDFRFSVKLSRRFLQEARLTEFGPELRSSLYAMTALGMKWGALLIQLPPSLIFDPCVASKFIVKLKEYSPHVKMFWEPRHTSWSCDLAMDLLMDHKITKVMADPEPCPLNIGVLTRMQHCRYFRMHGAPEIYRSNYEEPTLVQLADQLQHPSRNDECSWCIFDNTTFGFATANALRMQSLVRPLARDDFEYQNDHWSANATP